MYVIQIHKKKKCMLFSKKYNVCYSRQNKTKIKERQIKKVN